MYMETTHILDKSLYFLFVTCSNEELHDLYSSPSIIRIIKWRRMRWAGQCSTSGGEEERV
jgi:hypothetical protein